MYIYIYGLKHGLNHSYYPPSGMHQRHSIQEITSSPTGRSTTMKESPLRDASWPYLGM
jgi:hypothetical protein